MTDHEKAAVALTMLFAVVTAPMFLGLGERILKGRWPGKRDYERTLFWINAINYLSGMPIQTDIYGWQWRIIGCYSIGAAALLWAWLPIGLMLLIYG